MVHGDAGYQGVGKRAENRDADVDWRTAMKPGKRRLLDKDGAGEAAEKRKAAVRAKVEHPFLYVKRHFGYAKVRYRGLAKNTQRIALLLGFANLLIAGRYAVGLCGRRAPADRRRAVKGYDPAVFFVFRADFAKSSDGGFVFFEPAGTRNPARASKTRLDQTFPSSLHGIGQCEWHCPIHYNGLSTDDGGAGVGTVSYWTM